MISLAIGTERLSYAQTILEEKLIEVQDFQRNLQIKIGGSESLLESGGRRQGSDHAGTITIGLSNLLNSNSRYGKGMKRMLTALGLWSTWLRHLSRRA